MKIYSLILLLLLFVWSCGKEEVLKPAVLNKVDPKAVTPAKDTTLPDIAATNISLTLASDSLDADDVSYATVTFTISDSLLKYYKTVEFTLSPVGHFNDNSISKTIAFDVNGQAKVYVASASPGICNVLARVTNAAAKQAAIYFKAVYTYPDELTMTVDSAVIKADYSSTALACRLLKTNGALSGGQQVHYYDSTATGVLPGIFINTTLSNAAGISTASYALQDTSYHGFVYLKAYVNTPQGKVRGFNRVLLK